MKNGKTNQDKMGGALECPAKGFTRNNHSKSNIYFISAKQGRKEGIWTLDSHNFLTPRASVSICKMGSSSPSYIEL